MWADELGDGVWQQRSADVGLAMAVDGGLGFAVGDAGVEELEMPAAEAPGGGGGVALFFQDAADAENIAEHDGRGEEQGFTCRVAVNGAED
jgi:hypothetical protein